MKRIRKSIVVFVLLLVITLSFAFVWAKIQAQGAEDNLFNREWRDDFAAIPWLRQALGLHFDGDGKADYLGKHYQKILIEVDTMKDLGITLESLKLLTEKIQGVTGKPTSYLISDREILYDRELSGAEIENLVSLHRTHYNTGDTATIYLLYASRDQDRPTLLGATYQEYGIVLYGDALRDFTQDNLDLLTNYEASTALHEFGHQLGLGHNNDPGCLMNERVDSDPSWQHPEDVILGFCDYEKKLIPIY